MSEPADFYEILQVHPSAYPEVIDAAYRRLARIYHPDRHPAPDAAARMAEINRAYDVLKDPGQRAAYDRQGAGSDNGTADAVADVVRAKSFQLVNDAGQTRAELALDADGDPALVMNDRNGKRRFGIYQQADGSQQLVIGDQSGDVRLLVGESDDGGPMLYMTDQDGSCRLAIYQQEDGRQWLAINDRNGYVRLCFGETNDGTPTLLMRDGDGQTRANLLLGQDGEPKLVMNDRDGERRFEIFQDADGFQYLRINGRQIK